MKITQRMRRPAGWDDEQIAGIHAADTDIVLIRRPVPVECAEIVARGRVGEVRFQTTARGAKNKIDRGLDHLELKAPGSPRARLADDILGLICGMLAGFDWPRVKTGGRSRCDVARQYLNLLSSKGTIMPLKSATSPVLDGFRIAAVVVAVCLAATGCTQRAGVADKSIHAGHGHDAHAHSHDDHDHGHDHDHKQSHAPGKPTVDFPAAVAEVVRLDDTIRKAFAKQDTAAADEPIHAIGHLLEQLPELAEAHGSGVDVAAVKKSPGLLFEAYARIDGKLHGGDGSDYDTEAKGIARELATFRAFLVPPGGSAPKRD